MSAKSSPNIINGEIHGRAAGLGTLMNCSDLEPVHFGAKYVKMSIQNLVLRGQVISDLLWSVYVLAIREFVLPFINVL